MGSSVTVTPRAHWMNAWFLRLLARPIVRFDGEEQEAAWGRPCRIETVPGSHRVAVGARYRGTARVLGIAELPLEVAPGQSVVAEARNGVFNHQPFVVVIRTAAA